MNVNMCHRSGSTQDSSSNVKQGAFWLKYFPRCLELALILACFQCACVQKVKNEAGSAAKSNTREVLVVEAGKGSTAIILPEKPTCSAQYAALELQYHLEKITGEKVPITNEPNIPNVPVKIAIGATALGKSMGFPVDGLKDWEFMVAEKDGTIVLAGDDDPAYEKVEWGSLPLNSKPNGTCLAVFEFLEQYCNVHWYLPSEAGMVFPQTRKLAVQMGDTIRRKTNYRSTSFYPWQMNSNMFCAPDTPELTGDNVPDSDEEKWAKNLWTIPVTTKDMLVTTEVMRWVLRNKVGGESFAAGHGFNSWLTRFGRTHPEWFSCKSKEMVEKVLAKGSPQAVENEYHQTIQVCLTAPGVFEQFVADAREALGKKGARFIPLGLNDSYILCECQTCTPLYNRPVVDCPLWGGASGKASYYVYDFANRVAREIRKTHPDSWVGVIAYHDYMSPPRDFVLEPNVAVQICTYQGNYTPALRESAYKVIRAWREQAKCQWIGLWEYFCYYSMGQFPKVCPKLMAEDIKKLVPLGVKAEFIQVEDVYRFKDAPDQSCAIVSNPIWLYLNVWMRFKMWDNVNLGADQLLDDHYRLFYGPAAKPIQKFFERIEDRITDMSLRGPKTFSDFEGRGYAVDFEYLFPPEVMKELRGYVDEATSLADREPYKTRVGWVRMGFFEPQEKAQKRYLENKAKTPASRPNDGICYRLKEVPVIDGQGTDAAWSNVPAYYLSDWKTAARPKAETRFRMGYDDTSLYFLVRCDDPDVRDIRALCDKRDGDVWLDDSVEFHLTCDPLKSQRYQIVVNSKGVIQDISYILNEGGMDVANLNWNCEGVQTAAKVDDKGWTMEVKIPLAGVGGKAKPGARFYGNIAREKYSGSEKKGAEIQAWSPTMGGGFKASKYFGKMLMAEEDGWSCFFNSEAKPPAPSLADGASSNCAIRATADRECTRYTMEYPQAAEKAGRINATIASDCQPPIDVSRYPYLEISFSKPSADVMLLVSYDYDGDNGAAGNNYFVFSPWKEQVNTSRIFIVPWARGAGDGKPAPRFVKRLAVYAVVESSKTPFNGEFSLKWIRICKDTLRGSGEDH